MQVNLNWNRVAGAIFYRIYRSPFQGGPYQLIAQSNPNPSSNATDPGIKTTYQDGPGNLENGQDYYYRVSAVTVDGESAYGLEVAALWPGSPSSPVNVTAVVL